MTEELTRKQTVQKNLNISKTPPIVYKFTSRAGTVSLPEGTLTATVNESFPLPYSLQTITSSVTPIVSTNTPSLGWAISSRSTVRSPPTKRQMKPFTFPCFPSKFADKYPTLSQLGRGIQCTVPVTQACRIRTVLVIMSAVTTLRVVSSSMQEHKISVATISTNAFQLTASLSTRVTTRSSFSKPTLQTNGRNTGKFASYRSLCNEKKEQPIG